jgi:hypothetical protein
MKKLLSLIGLLGLVPVACGASQKSLPPLMKADTVAWVGLDYALVRMVGPNDFHNPEAIFPGMLDSWNTLFVRERIQRVGDALHKTVVLDTAGMGERNRQATTRQVIATGGPEDSVDQTHIAEADIAKAVKGYHLDTKEGLALVFVVDRLVKPAQKGAVYVVFFDARTREVLSCERHIGRAGGNGFRNYWFRVIKETDGTLKKYR